MASATLKIADVEVRITKKEIKNIHLSVNPPNGDVRLSVPKNTSDDVIRLLVIKRLSWIRKQREKFEKAQRQTERKFVSGESHYFKGKRYVLKLFFAKRPRIEIRNKRFIYFYVPAGYSTEQKRKYYENWLRKKLREELENLIPKWEKILGVKASEVKIKKMKTKWGSCNSRAKRIWINLELIKKPPEHLEYIIVHELLHFFEKKHNRRFKELLDKYLPKWEFYKKELNEFVL